MNQVLSEQQIDSILGKAPDGRSPLDAESRTVEPCDFRNSGQMSQQYARSMHSLYEGFARSTSNSLGAYLRTHFEMTLTSLELARARDFLEAFQETGFIVFLGLEPGASAALVQIDAALAFPIIDVLLGGFGAPAPGSRELTEIDLEIMEGVAQVLCRQLETTWQPLGISAKVDSQLKVAQAQNVFLPTEKLAVLTFEARLNEATAPVKMAFPAALAGAMLRESSVNPRRRFQAPADDHVGLRERMLECRFDSTIGLPNLKVPLRELMNVKPGSVLNLRLPVSTPASLVLGERDYFEAIPVRSGKNRAAQLLRPYPPPPDEF